MVRQDFQTYFCWKLFLRMKVRHVLIIISSALLIVAFVVVFSIGKTIGENAPKEDEAKEKSEEKVDTIRVFAETFSNKTVPVVAEGFGKVVSSSMINVTAEVQGVIQPNILLKKGTSFNKGQVLFSLKNTDIKIKLQARKSNFLTLITSALPDLKLDFPDNFEAWQKFYTAIDLAKTLPPLPEVGDFKEKNFIVSKGIYTEYYNIQADQESLKKYTIVAPFTGSIIESFTDEGAVVNPGSPVIAILRSGKMEIEVPISGDKIELVKEGAQVSLTDNEGVSTTGVVDRIGAYLNAQTQTIPVFISIAEEATGLYNGMYLDTQIDCDGVMKTIEIPRKAIFNKDQIFVVENGKIFSKSIDVELYTKKTALVTGLNDGVMIVVEPVLNGKDGAEVKVMSPGKL